MKTSGLLKLYVDGKIVAVSSPFDPTDFDLSNSSPLQIGFGQHDYFKGRMKDLRIYQRALNEEDIHALCKQPE